MKRRMAFLLALVMALALAIGVMPASAATTPEMIRTYVGQTVKFWVPEGFVPVIRQGSYGVINNLEAPHTSGSGGRDCSVTARGVGTAYIDIYQYSSTSGTGYDSSVRYPDVPEIKVIVSNSSSSSVDIDGGTLVLSTTYSKEDIFPTEKFTITAEVKTSSGQKVNSNQVTYIWSVQQRTLSSGPAAARLVSSNSNSATFEVTKGSDVVGTPGYLEVVCTAVGLNGSRLTTTWTIRKEENSSNSNGLTKAIKVYGGTVEHITYYDAKTNEEIPAINLQQLDASFKGTLPREFYLRSGDDVGYTTGKVIDHAYPSRLSFSAATSLTYDNIEIYVRDATAWDNRPTQPDYGSMGYVVLNQYYANNPYVIMVGIEAMNNLKAMNVGATQQITADMLGGVPVNAPGMSYKVADESIADVTQDGLVRAKKAGMTMLRVFCGEHEVINKQIFVLGSGTAFEDDPIIDEDGLYFGITSVTRSLEEKGDVRFRVSAKNLSVDGEKIGHDEVEWSSSDTSVARVDDEGYVSIRKVGECYIYGTYTNEDGKEFTSRFKVVVEE